MGNQIKYSTKVFFQKLCKALISGDLSSIQAAEAVQKKIDSINKLGGGFWPAPQGEKDFISILKTLQILLENNLSPQITEQFYREISNKKSFDTTKCKIVFFAQETVVWPSVEYLYRAAAADERFEAQLVYVPFSHPNMSKEDSNLRQYQAEGLPVINYKDYNLSAENPEVAVFIKPYNNIPEPYFFREVEKIVKRTIYIPYGLEAIKTLVRYAFHEYAHCSAWKHLVYGEVVKPLAEELGYRNGKNIAVWGHPRLDNYIVGNKRQVPDEWREKIADKKVVLWCPHHTINPGPECVSTWLDFYENIFRIFEEKKDLVLLWRPHPLLFGAIVNNGYMSQAEMDAFVQDKIKCANIILDQTGDYRVAFDLSDAIITDGTTFSLEYLMTGKPLILTAHSLDQFYNWEELGKAVYWAKDAEEIDCYVKLIEDETDIKKEVRELFKTNTFFVPEGTSISNNILSQILLEISKEESLEVYGENN